MLVLQVTENSRAREVSGAEHLISCPSSDGSNGSDWSSYPAGEGASGRDAHLQQLRVTECARLGGCNPATKLRSRDAPPPGQHNTTRRDDLLLPTWP